MTCTVLFWTSNSDFQTTYHRRCPQQKGGKGNPFLRMKSSKLAPSKFFWRQKELAQVEIPTRQREREDHALCHPRRKPRPECRWHGYDGGVEKSGLTRGCPK